MSSDFEYDVINWGEKITLKGPYAGVLGWPAQCGYSDRRCWPEADQSNMVEIIKGAREAGMNRKELPDPQDTDMLEALREPVNASVVAERMERKHLAASKAKLSKQHEKSGGGGGSGKQHGKSGSGSGKQHAKP